MSSGTAKHLLGSRGYGTGMAQTHRRNAAAAQPIPSVSIPVDRVPTTPRADHLASTMRGHQSSRGGGQCVPHEPHLAAELLWLSYLPECSLVEVFWKRKCHRPHCTSPRVQKKQHLGNLTTELNAPASREGQQTGELCGDLRRLPVAGGGGVGIPRNCSCLARASVLNLELQTLNSKPSAPKPTIGYRGLNDSIRVSGPILL